MELSESLRKMEEVSDPEEKLRTTPALTRGLVSFSLGLNLLLLEYIVLMQVTSLNGLMNMTTPFYAVASLFLMVAIPFVFGPALIQAITSETAADRWHGLGTSLLGGLVGLLSVGCPTCGAPLLAGLGIEGGLAAFPLQGLELKFVSVMLLAVALWPSAGDASGQEAATAGSDQRVDQEGSPSILVWNNSWGMSLVLVAAITAVFALPLAPERLKVNFSTTSAKSPAADPAAVVDLPGLAEQVNPAEGFAFQAKFGDIGPQLLASGVIDEEKFTAIYERGGDPLTEEQRSILTEGSDEGIVMSRENAHFLLNFFWALGLVNESSILDEGPMIAYSDGQIGRFASTGGWSLGTKAPTELYSSAQILRLTDEQQESVESVASGVFRPCCNNPTIFPDCNHGMAMLGLLELLASNGVGEEELYQAAKSANAFWFPQQMLQVAAYSKAVKGVDFSDLDPRAAVGSTYFSGSGFQSVNAWLADNGLIRQAPSQGSSCGV